MRAMQTPLGVTAMAIAAIFLVLLLTSIISSLFALTVFLVRRSRGG